MAVQSGSFNTTAYSNRYLTFSWSLQSQSIANNTSTIEWSLKGAGSASGYYLTQNITLIINGVTVYTHGQSPQIKLWNGTTVATGTAVITHGNTGTKTFTASCTAGIYEWSPNVSGSGSWELPTIPRYATITQSLNSKTETTAVIKWTSDSVCDALWYSTNNGSSWTSLSISATTNGSFTISGLSADTTYQVKTRVRRQDSQLTTDSTALSVKTYNYPYAKTMPNFTIGNAVTLAFENPLGRSFTFYVIANGTQIANSWTISGTSYKGLDGSTTQDQLYATIPSAQSATYQIKCVYSGHTVTKTGGTFTVNASACKPVIGAVTYRDTSSQASVTGDNQKIIRGKSVVQYTATGLAGSKSAGISSASVSVNGQTYTMSISGTTATGGNASIDSGTNVTATVTVTDSRGITASKSVTVTMLDYYLPTAIITLERHNNFYSETDITADFDYAYLDGRNTVTCAFQYKKTTDSTWSSQTRLYDNQTATFTADNAYAWDVKVIITDLTGGQTVYNLYLSRGMPIIYFDRIKSSVGVNCFPAHEDSFEVNGYDFLYHSGDTQSYENVVADAFLTTSTTDIRFSLPLPRICHNLTPSLTTLKVTIRKPEGGYVLSNGVTGYDILADNTITAKASLPTPNLMTIDMAKTTAYDGTNNTPLSIHINTLVVSFS